MAERLGFARVHPVTGQTYSRIVDAQIMASLAALAAAAHKMAIDVRLLAAFKEMDEPFEEEQVGSSAMAYKRNPVLDRTRHRAIAVFDESDRQPAADRGRADV